MNAVRWGIPGAGKIARGLPGSPRMALDESVAPLDVPGGIRSQVGLRRPSD